MAVPALRESDGGRRHARERALSWARPWALPGLVLATAAVTLLVLWLAVPPPVEASVVGVWAAVQLVVLHRLFREQDERAPDDPPMAGAVVVGAARVEEGPYSPDREKLHEVRTSVAGLRATHHLLHDHAGALAASARHRLESLYDSEIHRLERLLDDTWSPAATCVDLDSLLDPLLESLRLQGRPLTRRGGGGRVVGRADEVMQILQILLENAARHAPGRAVDVRVLRTPEQLVLEVADEGAGVPAQLAPYVFEPAVRSPESPGEGIGLPLARRLARGMGGDLRLETPQPGCGATFTLLLPVPTEET